MKLTRTLNVTVDESTWTDVAFPPALHANRETCDINILMLLLWIGYLTIPTSLRGVSTSEYWAWVRYWHAVSNNGDDNRTEGLKISRAFAELDPHQKTILSDDFGMGVPILWLNERVQFQSITDGRNFMDHLRGGDRANAGARKVGATKSPDFVARDTAGVWYVIECKGTQSGRAYRNRQLCERDEHGHPVGGAVVQKRTIQFGEDVDYHCLACGLSIATEGKQGSSDLRIVDPPSESSESSDNELKIGEANLKSAIEALSRGRLARALRLTGLSWAASAVSAPSVPSKNYQADGSDETRKRQEFIDCRRELAMEEISSLVDRRTEVVSGENYYTQSIELRLAVPIDPNYPLNQSASLRFYLNADFLRALHTDPLISEPRSKDSALWPWSEGPTKLIKDEGAASMQIGNLFAARIEIGESKQDSAL